MLTAIPKIDNMTESLNLSLNAIEEIDDYALRSDHVSLFNLKEVDSVLDDWFCHSSSGFLICHIINFQT